MKPSAALPNGHSPDDKVDSFSFPLLGSLLSTTNLFSLAGVVHQCTV